ncbi:exodeoxyribonuclease [Escherichia phage vB_EcoM-VpaE1]|uniref:Exodeoxyribonuclease n=1 Tax=Escherichia phage vB_EcoM-VpaE1 TaxID=1555238 RepID=A0A0A0RSF5_9CAUD|nr:exodeoxyribonuclease [Escherichia phage vB_EcoM-VpaE1]AIW02364.1 exodeoxyribonuclease [Escherichia phage vB_EcoM-VpaE1]
MEKYTLTKLPDSVTHVFIDSDSIAYKGACVVEKAKYKYVNKLTAEESEPFDNAKDAARWLADQRILVEELGLTFDEDEWERQTWKEAKSEKEAIMATQQVLQEWLKVVGKERTWVGYLTEKGVHKHKDIKGLEHQYQGNRKDAVTPTHLVACREYLLSRPEFKLILDGFEADSIVIAKAEKMGKKAALMSIDKDLRQAEGTYCIDMTYEKSPLIFIADNNVGEIWDCPIKSTPKAKKTVGVGFKFLCYQAVAGDNADNYFGLKGVGKVTIMKALEGKTTYKECLDAIYELYAKKESYTYVSWDGQTITRTPLELMQQHFFLAYQERNKKDDFTFDKYGWTPNVNSTNS